MRAGPRVTTSRGLTGFAAIAIAATAACAPLDEGPTAIVSERDALIENGRSLAEEQCAACHAVGITGESPNPNAPVFRTLLTRYNPETLETELVEGMRVAHGPMPQFQFNPLAAEGLIAYLKSIARRPRT